MRAAFRAVQEHHIWQNSTSSIIKQVYFQRGTFMKLRYLLLPLLSGILLSGCYTQLQTIERSPSERSGPYVMSDGGIYDSYYEDDLYAAYDQGYYDGLFDADIGFRSYAPRRGGLHAGFGWGGSFMGFGYSYGNYYDPYWHYAQLYDPYYYSSAGYFGVPYYMRYRHYGHFYPPFFGSGNLIVYNNYGNGSSGGSSYSGPRGSGVHRGNITSSRENRLVSRGTSAADTRTRLRGMGVGTLTDVANRGSIRTRSGYIPARGSIERIRIRSGASSRGTIDRRRAVPPRSTSRTSPQRRGSSSSGRVERSRGSSSSSGRSTGRSRSSGSSSEGRSRGSSSSSGERKRGGDDGLSMMMPAQHQSYAVVMINNSVVLV